MAPLVLSVQSMWNDSPRMIHRALVYMTLHTIIPVTNRTAIVWRNSNETFSAFPNAKDIVATHPR